MPVRSFPPHSRTTAAPSSWASAYGKGSVQNMIELESGKSAMKLTTAKYLRPSGKNIHRFPDSKETDDWGVRPDIEFKQTRKEEFDYWLTRRDRDIIRTEPTKAERAEQVAAFCFPLGSLTAWGQPFQGVMTAASCTPRSKCCLKPR